MGSFRGFNVRGNVGEGIPRPRGNLGYPFPELPAWPIAELWMAADADKGDAVHPARCDTAKLHFPECLPEVSQKFTCSHRWPPAATEQNIEVKYLPVGILLSWYHRPNVNPLSYKSSISVPEPDITLHPRGDNLARFLRMPLHTGNGLTACFELVIHLACLPVPETDITT